MAGYRCLTDLSGLSKICMQASNLPSLSLQSNTSLLLKEPRSGIESPLLLLALLHRSRALSHKAVKPLAPMTSALRAHHRHVAGLRGTSRDFAGFRRTSRGFVGLRGTSRDFAGLSGTSRDFAGLRGTSRDFAWIRGISRYFASLRGSSRYFAGLRGFSLDFA